MSRVPRLCLLALTCLHPACADVDAGSRGPDVIVAPEARYRAMTFSSRRAPEAGTLEELRDLGVSHITLIPFGYQRAFDVPEIRFDPDRRWFTESDSGIAKLAAQAKTLGMGTMLKPHIWVGHYSTDGQQRNQIGFRSDEEWATWESTYRRFILHYAGLARRIDADVFVIGTELATAALQRPEFWRSLIPEVRAEYGGRLTYAANWYREFEDISFWADLDAIGVQAYFPLSDRPDPDLDELTRGWVPHLEALAGLSRKHGRPILFTEIGYRSATESAAEPWRWASRQKAQLTEPDYPLQADLYRAFFDAVWPQPWFGGASIWRWHTDSESRSAVRSIDFTPQHKPSLDVLRHGFTSSGQIEGSGTAGRSSQPRSDG